MLFAMGKMRWPKKGSSSPSSNSSRKAFSVPPAPSTLLVGPAVLIILAAGSTSPILDDLTVAGNTPPLPPRFGGGCAASACSFRRADEGALGCRFGRSHCRSCGRMFATTSSSGCLAERAVPLIVCGRFGHTRANAGTCFSIKSKPGI